MRSSTVLLAAAACMNNCVVYGKAYYNPPAEVSYAPYTDTPAETFTTVYTHPGNTTTKPEPTYPGKPPKPGHPGEPGEPGYPNPTEPGKPHEPLPTNPNDCITRTTTIVYPHPTITGSKVTRTITYTIPKEPSHNTTAVYPPNPTYVPKPTGGAPHPNNTTPGGGKGLDGDKGAYGSKGNDAYDDGYDAHEAEEPDETATRLPSQPTSAPDTVPTAGAAMNTASALLAIVGFAAAYLI
ncbi:hypothetical protein ACJ41O_005195 [Fusarium nematophilum]